MSKMVNPGHGVDLMRKKRQKPTKSMSHLLRPERVPDAAGLIKVLVDGAPKVTQEGTPVVEDI